jgi:hypothetical protein
MVKRVISTELGTERRCTKCNEYWPEDSEFFYTSGGKIQQPCKACYCELPSRKARKANQVKVQRIKLPLHLPANISLRANA